MRSFFVTVFSFVAASLFAKEMPFKEIVVALDNYNPQIQIARAKIESNQISMRTERNLDDPSVEYLLINAKRHQIKSGKRYN